jgi:ribosomal protein S18 acetylase RimI-like enzyme
MCLPGEMPPYTMVPASSFTADELAELFNRTRDGFIVPMSMNAKKMQTYIRSYDIDLDASWVLYDTEEQMAGLGMLGVRDDRAWITRLGIIPERRGKCMGQLLMETLIQSARIKAARLIQLEVIEGNTPAHSLFTKLGFQDTRRLLIIRRPPGLPKVQTPDPSAKLTPLTESDIYLHLAQRGPGAAWTNENASLLKVNGLEGFKLRLASGYTGWVVYQPTVFELNYVVLYAPAQVRDPMTANLLYHLHQRHPILDTKIENIPLNEVCWPIYEEIGYIESFRRIEMYLHL